MKFKKIIALAVAMFIAFSLFAVSAAGNTTSISISGTKTVGSTIVAKFKVSASNIIGSADVTIKYDTLYFKFQSLSGVGSSDYTVDGGSIHIIDMDFNGSSKSAGYSVTFSLLKEGSGKISFSGTYGDIEYNDVALSGSSVSVDITSKATSSKVTSSKTTSSAVSSAVSSISNISSEESEREENKSPLCIEIDNEDYYIQQKIEDSESLSGYFVEDDLHNGESIQILKSENGDQIVYVLKKDDLDTLFYYVYSETEDKFIPLSYKIVNNKTIIFCDLPQGEYSSKYERTTTNIDSFEVSALYFTDTSLSDYCMLYCNTTDGNMWYRYDSYEGSFQRELNFDPFEKTEFIEETNEDRQIFSFSGLINKLNNGTLLYVLIGVITLCIIGVIVLIIVLTVSKGKNKEKGFEIDTKNFGFPEDAGFDVVSYMDANSDNDGDNQGE